MDPVTIKITAQLAATLAKSRTLRRIVIAAAVVWALILAVLFLVPLQFVPSTASQARLIAAASCAGQPGFAVPMVSGRKSLAVTVATWNTKRANSQRNVLAGLRAIAAAGADVIGVQELSSNRRRNQVRRAMAQLGWGMSKGNNAVPLFYRKGRYRLITQDSQLVFRVRRIESGVAGTSIGPKSIQWVQLQDRSTEASFVVANHHLVPSIDDHGRPDRRKPRRVRLARLQLAAAATLTERLKVAGPVFWTADWNIDARQDAQRRDPRWPYIVMGRHGLRSNWATLGTRDGGTHAGGRRLIDYVMTTGAAALRQRRLGFHGSDHRPVLVTATNRLTSTVSEATATTSTSRSSVPDRLVVPGPRSGSSMTLAGEQTRNAAVIITEGRSARIPQYGWIVAVATALQESGLRMLNHGDRDSVNMFQQRPTAGWGSPAQLADPHLATRAFYGVATHTSNPGLTDIDGWQQLSVARAAQAVQRSAFPDAYAKWEAAARSIVQQLDHGTSTDTATPELCGTGQDQALGTCPASGSPAEKGLTRDALMTLRCIHGRFPQITSFGGVHPDPLPDHPSGRAVDFMIPNYRTSAGNRDGWEVARWLRAHRVELGVAYVIFDGRIWSTARDAEGWRTYRPGYTSSITDSSMHRNHVHVTVHGNAGTGFRNQPTAPGGWVMPLPAGSYRVGCGFGCYAGHSGQDFPAPSGTRVLAATAGTVTRSVALRDRAGRYVSYGNLIVIRSPGGVETFYAHLQHRQVRVGDSVRAGQLIGLSGHSCNVRPSGEAGAHLHFEIRIDGNPVNPLSVLQQKGLT